MHSMSSLQKSCHWKRLETKKSTSQSESPLISGVNQAFSNSGWSIYQYSKLFIEVEAWPSCTKQRRFQETILYEDKKIGLKNKCHPRIPLWEKAWTRYCTAEFCMILLPECTELFFMFVQSSIVIFRKRFPFFFCRFVFLHTKKVYWKVPMQQKKHSLCFHPFDKSWFKSTTQVCYSTENGDPIFNYVARSGGDAVNNIKQNLFYNMKATSMWHRLDTKPKWNI